VAFLEDDVEVGPAMVLRVAPRHPEELVVGRAAGDDVVDPEVLAGAGETVEDVVELAAGRAGEGDASDGFSLAWGFAEEEEGPIGRA
jgi:hypothetical protein